MIIVAKPTGQRFALNPDLIMRVDDADPHTLITMVDGVTIPVQQSVDQVAEIMTSYRLALINARQASDDTRLRLVRPTGRSGPATRGED